MSTTSVYLSQNTFYTQSLKSGRSSSLYTFIRITFECTPPYAILTFANLHLSLPYTKFISLNAIQETIVSIAIFTFIQMESEERYIMVWCSSSTTSINPSCAI